MIWKDAELKAMLSGPQGPVVRDLGRRAYRVRSGAVAACPVDTGRLRSSINVSMGGDFESAYADIGTNVEYALYVHEGTRYMEGRPFLTDALHLANE